MGCGMAAALTFAPSLTYVTNRRSSGNAGGARFRAKEPSCSAKKHAAQSRCASEVAKTVSANAAFDGQFGLEKLQRRDGVTAYSKRKSVKRNRSSK
jgi:hypothetical protein